MITRICNGRLLRHHKLIQEDLWIQDNKIISPQQQADKVIDANGLIVAPGYIDLQINGAQDIDIVSQPERVGELAKVLRQHGVTSFLPTLISSKKERYQKAIRLLQPREAILGIHLEGPYFNPERKGAHDPSNIIPSLESFEELYSNLNGIKLITLAPELPGALEAIRALSKKGIIVSAGHSNATFRQMEEAQEAGLKMVTHLFNGMGTFHHREPGIIGTALSQKGLFYSIIADGAHVHPMALKMAWNANPDGLILISDAIASNLLGDMKVEIVDDTAYIAGTRTLAGSTLLLDGAVRYFKQATDCSVVEALEAASLKPAMLLGIEKTKGTLNIGADADIIFLNDDLFVELQ